jgi:y4mF family transcriptional regulator
MGKTQAYGISLRLVMCMFLHISKCASTLSNEEAEMRLQANILGEFIVHARKQQGLTQEQLAKKTQVSRRWLSDVENGKTSVDFWMVQQLISDLGYQLEVHPRPEV